MDVKHDEAVSSLRTKIKKIIYLYEEEKNKNITLETRIRELTDKINNLEKKLTDTETKYDNLKLAKSVLGSGENSHDAKIRVNRIVREIDKCIALLNR